MDERGPQGPQGRWARGRKGLRTRGPQGPVGDRGASWTAGPQGPQGLQGIRGMYEWQVVNSAPQHRRWLRDNWYAECPAGTEVIGGGAWSDYTVYGADVTGVSPRQLQGYVAVVNRGSKNVAACAFAVCSTGFELERRRSRTSSQLDASRSPPAPPGPPRTRRRCTTLPSWGTHGMPGPVARLPTHRHPASASSALYSSSVLTVSRSPWADGDPASCWPCSCSTSTSR